MQKNILAVTMGDPCGIGGEVFLKSWRDYQSRGGDNNFILLDDPARVTSLIDFLGLDISLSVVEGSDAIAGSFSKPSSQLRIYPIKQKIPFYLGRHRDEGEVKISALGALESLDTAIELTQKKIAVGMVTAPLDKSVIHSIMPHFLGHTSYLAEKDKTKNYAMMLLAEENEAAQDDVFFRTVPLTTHIPLRQVATDITPDHLHRGIILVADELKKKFGVAQPRLAVAGINPHAGDGGIMGREEIDVMIPVIENLRRGGMMIDGPLPADSLFTPSMRKQYDVFLCPNHDQALIPIKTLFFDKAVNLTLGLSYIRVSPDHGTAFAIADKNCANYLSMLSAIRLAQKLIKSHD